MSNWIPPQIPVLVKPSALMKDVSSCFNRIQTTQTRKVFIREELEMVFSYWSMIGYSSHVKIVDGGLCFYFLFSLYFIFLFLFLLFLEQLRWGLSVTLSHQSQVDGIITRLITRLKENRVEGSGTRWCHTTWTTHVGLMSYTWSFRIGCTVVSTDHE